MTLAVDHLVGILWAFQRSRAAGYTRRACRGTPNTEGILCNRLDCSNRCGIEVNFIFRLLLTFNATILLVIVYLVNKSYVLSDLLPQIEVLTLIPKPLSFALYLCIPFFSTLLSIFLSTKLGADEFKAGQVVSVEHANNSFLPSYLGYFFVALSISDSATLLFIYVLLFAFTFRSQALYFNPIFLMFGFEFYNIKTTDGVTIFLISQNHYRTPKDVVLPKAYRINDYTFIKGKDE